jgi:hypothetical protein
MERALREVRPGETTTPFTQFKLENAGRVGWQPGMRLDNAANGNISDSSLAYQFTIQTTTAIRQDVVRQKFYEVPPADFMPVLVGLGAWMEDIKTIIEFQAAGAFEGGYISTAQSPSQLGNVDVATAPVEARIWTWAKAYRYSIIEINKALAFNNWNIIQAKIAALMKHAQLGLQKISFLGNIEDLTGTPGLLSNASVNVNTAVIPQNLSSMTYAQLQVVLADILEAYFANSNNTVLPDTWAMPIDDYLGLGAFVNPQFPLAGSTFIAVLEETMKRMTGNKNFRIMGLLYGKASANAGYWASLGTNRHALYRNNPDTLKMDVPVPFTMNPAVPVGSINYEGSLMFQHTGAIFYRPAECLYFDH